MFEIILVARLVFTTPWLYDRQIYRGDQNIAFKVKGILEQALFHGQSIRS